MRPRKLRRLLALIAFGWILAATGIGWVARADVTDGVGTQHCDTRSWSPCPEYSHPVDRDPALWGPIGNSAVGGRIG